MATLVFRGDSLFKCTYGGGGVVEKGRREGVTVQSVEQFPLKICLQCVGVNNVIGDILYKIYILTYFFKCLPFLLLLCSLQM